MAYDAFASLTQKQPPAPPRALGETRVTARLRGARSVLADLRQAGSAKVLLPREPGDDLTAVLLNTAGGVTGGDRFSHEAEAAQGARLTLATQAAERGYRAMAGETGRVSVRLSAAPGAALHWLPQETILFDGAALHRRLDADLSGDAELLAAEAVVIGRAAMGERVHDLSFRDDWRVRRDGRLVYADALAIEGDAEAILAGPAALGGASAFATILFAAPAAEARLSSLRALLPETAGASLVRDGVLVARIAATGGQALRRALLPALELLRAAPLPRVWRI